MHVWVCERVKEWEKEQERKSERERVTMYHVTMYITYNQIHLNKSSYANHNVIHGPIQLRSVNMSQCMLMLNWTILFLLSNAPAILYWPRSFAYSLALSLEHAYHTIHTSCCCGRIKVDLSASEGRKTICQCVKYIHTHTYQDYKISAITSHHIYNE